MSTHDCPSTPCPICGGPGIEARMTYPSWKDWKTRAEKAEAEVRRLRSKLASIMLETRKIYLEADAALLEVKDE